MRLLLLICFVGCGDVSSNRLPDTGPINVIGPSVERVMIAFTCYARASDADYDVYYDGQFLTNTELHFVPGSFDKSKLEVVLKAILRTDRERKLDPPVRFTGSHQLLHSLAPGAESVIRTQLCGKDATYYAADVMCQPGSFGPPCLSAPCEERCRCVAKQAQNHGASYFIHMELCGAIDGA